MRILLDENVDRRLKRDFAEGHEDVTVAEAGWAEAAQGRRRRRYKDLEEPPPRPEYRRRASVLDPYVPYLVRRWNEGCHNGRRLYREIREQGYSRCRTNVDRLLLAEFRRATSRGKPVSSVPRARKSAVAGSFPSAKNAAVLFVHREEKPSAEQGRYLERLAALDPALADAAD